MLVGVVSLVIQICEHDKNAMTYDIAISYALIAFCLRVVMSPFADDDAVPGNAPGSCESWKRKAEVQAFVAE